jgi:hypothetical protein
MAVVFLIGLTSLFFLDKRSSSIKGLEKVACVITDTAQIIIKGQTVPVSGAI